MRYATLGETGPAVSELGLGCAELGSGVGPAEARAVVEAALEAGVTYFDTADSYGAGASETVLGEVLRSRRDSVVIATKFGRDAGVTVSAPRASRKYMRAALEESLRRLRTDYIDLYQQHDPDDSDMLDDTIYSLNLLVGEGKIRAFGSSNYEPWRIAEADSVARAHNHGRPCSARSRYNLLHREPETSLIPYCVRSGISLVASSPLAGGLLAGESQRTESAGPLAKKRVQTIQEFAAESGTGILNVAIGAILARPGVTSVLVNAMTPGQVRATAGAATWRPAEADLGRLDSIAPPGSAI
ncbi:MAG: aldo/keto reductase [Streptosporangiaceae bacterium]|nr:aldo/keto reductase [Streptosporangiaceae bacterium]